MRLETETETNISTLQDLARPSIGFCLIKRRNQLYTWHRLPVFSGCSECCKSLIPQRRLLATANNTRVRMCWMVFGSKNRGFCKGSTMILYKTFAWISHRRWSFVSFLKGFDFVVGVVPIVTCTLWMFFRKVWVHCWHAVLSVGSLLFFT